jgi:5-methylcytosine-specific restriction enzyme subunit McrC
MIPIKNLFFILCYAWGRLDEGELVSASVDEVKTPQDLLARILINGANRVLKDGLDRGYLEFAEESSSLRGKIDFSTSISRLLFEQAKAATFVDELSHNILHNQILKTTLLSLSNSDLVDAKLRPELARLVRKFNDVDLIRLTASVFKRVKIHQNNSFYAFLTNVCELVFLQGTPSSEIGNIKIRDFSRDEVKMRKVFQDFVFNFYKLNQKEYSVSSPELKWGAVGDYESLKYLPVMRTDVTLSSPSRKIILDTKYYKEAFQFNFGKKSIQSEHLYQLNAYLDSAQRTVKEGQKIDGILLYPATNDEFIIEFELREHSVVVAAIDMRQDSIQISQRLMNLLMASESA